MTSREKLGLVQLSETVCFPKAQRKGTGSVRNVCFQCFIGLTAMVVVGDIPMLWL